MICGRSNSRVAAADVVGDRVVEDEVVLQDHAIWARSESSVTHSRLLSSMRISPRGRIEEARQQVDEGVLLASIGADQADALAGLRWSG